MTLLNMLNFVAPAPSAELIKIAQQFWPIWTTIAHRGLEIQIDAGSLSILKSLRNQSAVLCANHSSHDDPLSMFGLSRVLNERFYFLTAREIFKHFPSASAIWLQHLGCYSIVRAAADVEAFKTTINLLAERNAKIVLFPEGEISHQNRTLLRVEPGAEHAIRAANKALSKKGAKKRVLIVPIGMLYRYKNDVRDKLLEIIKHLEESLKLVPPTSPGLTARLRRAFEACLARHEADYNLRGDGLDLDSRIANLCDRATGEIATACAIDLPQSADRVDRLHLLRNWLCEIRFGQGKNTCRISPESRKKMFRTTRKLTNIIAVSERTFSGSLTQDQAAEIAGIIEFDLYGKLSLKEKRVVSIHVNQPLIADDGKNGSLTQALEQGIHNAVTQLIREHPSLLVS